MKKTLSMILVAIMIMALPIAMADESIEIPQTSTGFGFDLDITPGNVCPEILPNDIVYHVNTWIDETTSNPWLVPVAMMSPEDLYDIAFEAGWSGRSYAFDGEVVTISFNAIDQDGMVDQCLNGFVTLDCGYDPKVVQCVKKTIEFEGQPAAHFDCTYIVESADVHQGECWISVSVEDECGECMDTTPGILSLYLNPAVGITYSPQASTDGFGFKYTEAGDLLMRIVNGQVVEGPMPGDTVYTPYFTVENSADPETGLYILLKMYGTDFVASNTNEVPPLCPLTNRLEISQMEYMARHLNAQQGYTQVPDGTNYGALESNYIFRNWAPGGNGAANFLGVGDDITMRLRLNIPSPCQGEFTLGGEVMFVAAVI